MKIVSQARIRPHNLVFPAVGQAFKYRLFSEKILAWAEVSTDASSFLRAGAILGWTAGHALHPGSELHPDGWALGLDVLPAGETWATFNDEFDQTTNILRDNGFWFGLYPDGRDMIEALIGTVDSEGAVADDGMLTEFATNQWRLRNFEDFRAVQCTLQCKIAQVLLAAQGIHALDLTINGHDPMMLHENETGRWLWIDETYGTWHQITGSTDPLTALETLTLSLAGRSGEIEGIKSSPMNWILGSFFEAAEQTPGVVPYPYGVEWLAVHARPQWAGGISNRAPYRFPASHDGFPDEIATYQIGNIETLTPELGCGFGRVVQHEQSIEIHLRSSWPGHVGYERSIDHSGVWATCDDVDYLTPGLGMVQYRSVDNEGFSGKPALVMP